METRNIDSETPVYFWKQAYGMGDGSVHWALCDTQSERDGRVSCCYMVLLANYPNGIDGKPVGEQYMPKKIVEALNNRALIERENQRLREALEANTQALAFMAGAFGHLLKPEHKERNQRAFLAARSALQPEATP